MGNKDTPRATTAEVESGSPGRGEEQKHRLTKKAEEHQQTHSRLPHLPFLGRRPTLFEEITWKRGEMEKQTRNGDEHTAPVA